MPCALRDLGFEHGVGLGKLLYLYRSFPLEPVQSICCAVWPCTHLPKAAQASAGKMLRLLSCAWGMPLGVPAWKQRSRPPWRNARAQA